MKRIGIGVVALMMILPIAGAGWAEQHAAKGKGEPPSWKTATMVEESATVTAIDQKTRMVTLKGPKGNEVTFKAGPEVRNLAQVKTGDEVKFAYYESLAVRVLKKDEAAPAASEATAVARAKPGEKPGVVAGTETTVVATIEAIDKKAKTATLKGADGKSVTVTPRDPKRLDQVKVGDRIVLTYTEAIAISVEKVEKKK